MDLPWALQRGDDETSANKNESLVSFCDLSLIFCGRISMNKAGKALSRMRTFNSRPVKPKHQCDNVSSNHNIDEHP